MAWPSMVTPFSFLLLDRHSRCGGFLIANRYIATVFLAAPLQTETADPGIIGDADLIAVFQSNHVPTWVPRLSGVRLENAVSGKGEAPR